MSTVTFKYYSDPDNAWLEVPYQDLDRAGYLCLVSIHSYQNGGMLYLDRYWDSDRLIQYFARAGIIVKLDVHHSNTPSVIRNYRRFYYDPYGRRQKDLTDYYYDFKESMASFFS